MVRNNRYRYRLVTLYSVTNNMNSPLKMKAKTLGIRRNLKEQQRRDAIIRSAIKVFSTKGFKRATMDDIAIEAGFSKSLIYWYWKNKAALFSELTDICLIKYRDLLQETLESQEPFQKKFSQLIIDFTAIFKQNDSLNKLVHFGSLHYSEVKEENFKEKVRNYYRALEKELVELLQQGIDERYLNKDIDLSAIAFTILTTVEGYIYMSMLEKRMPVERSIVNVLLASINSSIVA